MQWPWYWTTFHNRWENWWSCKDKVPKKCITSLPLPSNLFVVMDTPTEQPVRTAWPRGRNMLISVHLPTSIRDTDCLLTFKKRLKHLFPDYNGTKERRAKPDVIFLQEHNDSYWGTCCSCWLVVTDLTSCTRCELYYCCLLSYRYTLSLFEVHVV